MPIEFADTLPEGCPPGEASSPKSEHLVYRLVESNPPTEVDFTSHWKLYPHKRHTYSNECIARAVSVCQTVEQCQNLKSLPTMRGKLACRVKITPEAGIILLNRKSGHISWWLAMSFDPVQHSEVLE